MTGEINMKKQLPYMIALCYALLMVAALVITGDDMLIKINIYVADAVALWAAALLMTHVIREHNDRELLYTALGMCCLVLGNLYFLLLDAVSFAYDVIAVGYFAKVCCYLFFIAVLTAAKQFRLKRAAVVDVASFAVAATCAYAVIANSYLVINVSVILLNLLLVILACGLLKSQSRVRFFARVMLFLAIKDILSVFSFLSFPTDVLSPLLYLLIVASALRMREEEAYV